MPLQLMATVRIAEGWSPGTVLSALFLVVVVATVVAAAFRVTHRR